MLNANSCISLPVASVDSGKISHSRHIFLSTGRVYDIPTHINPNEYTKDFELRTSSYPGVIVDENYNVKEVFRDYPIVYGIDEDNQLLITDYTGKIHKGSVQNLVKNILPKYPLLDLILLGHIPATLCAENIKITDEFDIDLIRYRHLPIPMRDAVMELITDFVQRSDAMGLSPNDFYDKIFKLSDIIFNKFPDILKYDSYSLFRAVHELNKTARNPIVLATNLKFAKFSPVFGAVGVTQSWNYSFEDFFLIINNIPKAKSCALFAYVNTPIATKITGTDFGPLLELEFRPGLEFQLTTDSGYSIRDICVEELNMGDVTLNTSETDMTKTGYLRLAVSSCPNLKRLVLPKTVGKTNKFMLIMLQCPAVEEIVGLNKWSKIVLEGLPRLKVLDLRGIKTFESLGIQGLTGVRKVLLPYDKQLGRKIAESLTYPKNTALDSTLNWKLARTRDSYTLYVQD